MEVKTTAELEWQYESLGARGVCAVSGTPLSARLTLSRVGSVVPDVEEVERWLSAHLTRPTTAEALCEAACRYWRTDARVVCTAPTHGTITAVCRWLPSMGAGK